MAAERLPGPLEIADFFEQRQRSSRSLGRLAAAARACLAGRRLRMPPQPEHAQHVARRLRQADDVRAQAIGAETDRSPDAQAIQPQRVDGQRRQAARGGMSPARSMVSASTFDPSGFVERGEIVGRGRSPEKSR